MVVSFHSLVTTWSVCIPSTSRLGAFSVDRGRGWVSLPPYPATSPTAEVPPTPLVQGQNHVVQHSWPGFSPLQIDRYLLCFQGPFVHSFYKRLTQGIGNSRAAVPVRSPQLESRGLMVVCLLSGLGTALPLSEPQLCIQMGSAGTVAGST